MNTGTYAHTDISQIEMFINLDANICMSKEVILKINQFLPGNP